MMSGRYSVINGKIFLRPFSFIFITDMLSKPLLQVETFSSNLRATAR